MSLPYPPPWQDIGVLCEHIGVCEATVDKWIKLNLLPAGRLRCGKRLWKWSEVNTYLENGGPNVPVSPDILAKDITDATKRACARQSV